VAGYYALLAFAYAQPLRAWSAAPLVVALCFLSFFCAVITHNTVHAPIFRSKLLNRWFQVALTNTYGHPVSMFVPGHNLSHHRYLQQPRDRMRTDKLRFGWNLLNQVLFSSVVGGAIFRDNLDYARAMRTRRPRWFRQLLLETASFILFVGVLLFLNWKKFLLFVLIPHQYAVWGITGVNFVQHEGCDADSPYNHSRNFTGRLTNWLTFNNGFHGIHHMHPSLHWSLLREAHARELSPHIDRRLEQPSIVAYCARAYLAPGKRMRFDGTPVVLGPPRADEPWVPTALAPEDLEPALALENDLDHGAVAH
jgi:fatty acid desaturase